LEYGTAGFTPGQVLGGRWKPSHYILRRALLRDDAVACGGDGRCYVRHDSHMRALNATATFQLVHTRTGAGAGVPIASFPISLPAGIARIAWVCLTGGEPLSGCNPLGPWLSANGCASDGTDCVVEAAVADGGGGGGGAAPLVTNTFLMAPPGSLAVPAGVTAAFALAPLPNPDGSVNVTVTTSGSALFVTLTTLAAGRFSDNAFHVWGQGGVVVAFVPWGGLDYGLLATTLRVEHARSYF
jgi:beta-mannosidase